MGSFQCKCNDSSQINDVAMIPSNNNNINNKNESKYLHFFAENLLLKKEMLEMKYRNEKKDENITLASSSANNEMIPTSKSSNLKHKDVFKMYFILFIYLLGAMILQEIVKSLL